MVPEKKRKELVTGREKERVHWCHFREGKRQRMGSLPINTKTNELSRAEYPRYTTPLVQLVQLTSLIQYSKQLAKTYAALAPAVKKLLHCQ